MSAEWKNLDQIQAFTRLTKAGFTGRVTAGAERVITGPLEFHYGASLMSDAVLDDLQALADEHQLVEKYQILRGGERVNTGENRMVLHHLTRGQNGPDVVDGGQNLRSFYLEQNQRIRSFAEKVHNGRITGATGRPFDTVVQIGIGGSDLGPRALYLALKNGYTPVMTAHFVSNVDPDDALDVLSQINPESTLFILVSKSGTTQETLANRDLIMDRIREQCGFDASRHLIAVTSKTSPLADSDGVLDSFFIDDYIGGRYSSTSAVGAAVLSLALGPGIFDTLLEGAHDADTAAAQPDIRQNAALLDALCGVFYRNVMGWPATAVLPYSQALSRFPAHLQQLDMESNGKSVNRFGQPLPYSTGPLVFGEPGTNGQHSFYQLLHQGTDIVPLQFIGFRHSQSGAQPGQVKLNANLAAQIIAFAEGRRHENQNKNFSGGRPSTLLTADRLDARTLGALLAHFENKIMFQGFCWNVNSFDQEGVQLGKILTGSLLDGTAGSEALKMYASVLGVPN